MAIRIYYGYVKATPTARWHRNSFLSSLVNCQMLVTAFVFMKENPYCSNGWLVEWLRSLAALVSLSNIESGVLLDSSYTPHTRT